MATRQELAESIEAYSKLSEDQLLAELGSRVKEMEDDPVEGAIQLAAVGHPSLDTSKLAGPVADELKAIGYRFLQRYNRALYDLMCNPKDPDNAKFKNAILSGGESAGLVLGGFLLAHFFWLPGIVTLVASLLVKKFASCTYDEACFLWGEQLK